MERLERELRVDASRIYATGFSAGAIFSYRLAAERSELFSAVAPVAATIGGQGLDEGPVEVIPEPSAPVSIMHLHSRQDQAVPYDGGETSPVYTPNITSMLSVAESIAFWVEADDCPAEPRTEMPVADSVIVDTWAPCAEGSEVILVTLEDLADHFGHLWPTIDNSGFDATTEILDFFSRHALAASDSSSCPE